jgi:hypothetical protein
LDAPSVLSLIACPREAGAACPHCAGTIVVGDRIMVCQGCGGVHHRSCWDLHAGCGSYACAPARRLGGPAPAPSTRLTITAEEIDRVVPLPSARAPSPWGVAVPIAPPAPPRTSGLAIAAFICGLAGIPLFGVITGLVAILLGCLALSNLRGRKGLGLAVSGLVLGVVDVVGWVVFLGIMLSRPVPAFLSDALPPDFSTSDLPPEIRRGMEANVLIERRHGLSSATGSGVILDIANGQALIVTSRHVVDPQFPSEPKLRPGGEPDFGRLTVLLLGQRAREAEGVWAAPGDIDLALIRVPCTSDTVQAARWRGGAPPRVGDPVFAIGNPHRLGWTHTQGVISQFRAQEAGGRRLRVIQTQAAINPGNSGGGLYGRDGTLIGINTWTHDKRSSEGLGFAIALQSLLELAPPALPPEPKVEAGEKEAPR